MRTPEPSGEIAAPVILMPASALAPVAFVARLHATMASAEPVWRQLQADGTLTVYQKFEWASLMVQHLLAVQGAQLAVVEVQQAGTLRPVMLFPMVVRRKHGQRRLEWLSFGVCDYIAPLMAKGLEISAAAASAAWKEVKSVLPAADCIHFAGAPESVFGRPNPLAMLARSRPTDQEAFGIVLEGDAETVVQRLCKPSFAADMRKRVRMFAKFPDYRFFAAATEAEVEQVFSTLIEQRRKRFSQLGRFDILNNAEFVAFYRAAALDGLAGGPARVFAVQADGELVATSLGLLHNGAFHGILLAMGDDKWRTYGPGLFMIAQSMQWARSQGLDYFDMTVGSLPYKEGMGARSQRLLEYSEALTWRGKLFQQVEQAATGVRQRIKANKKAYNLARKLAQGARKAKTLLKR